MQATTSRSENRRAPAKTNRWNWRRELNYFFVALTEILWLVPLLVLISYNNAPQVFPTEIANVFALVAVHVLMALFLTRFLAHRRLTSNQQFPYLVLACALSVVLTLAALPLLTGSGDQLAFPCTTPLAISGCNVASLKTPIALWGYATINPKIALKQSIGRQAPKQADSKPSFLNPPAAPVWCWRSISPPSSSIGTGIGQRCSNTH